MRIDPRDYFQSCMLLDIYDPLSVTLARRYARPESVAIDAGAHLGYFTMKIADAVGPKGAVFAFECDPRLASRLRQHLEWNRFSWVHVEEAALSDGHTSTVSLGLTKQLGWASVKDEHWVRAQGRLDVDATSLDDYLRHMAIPPEDLSFIKLDVEGAELEALQGSAKTLDLTSAAVLVEFLPERIRAMGQDPDDILSIMHSHGYDPWLPVAAGWRKTAVKLSRADASSSGDFLFLKPSSAG
jgi:FkbM family methyltransferase